MNAITQKPPLLDRATRYAAHMPAAVSGQGGHRATFAVAVALVHGFALGEADAFAILSAYNTRCTPPWSERELRHKLASASKLTRHPQPRGHLVGLRPSLDAHAQDHAAVASPPAFQFVDPAALPLPPAEHQETVVDREDHAERQETAVGCEATRIAASLRQMERDHPGLLIRPDGTLTPDATLFAAVLRKFGGTYRGKKEASPQEENPHPSPDIHGRK